MKDPQQERQGYQLLLGHFVPQLLCFQYGCRQPSQLKLQAPDVWGLWKSVIYIPHNFGVSVFPTASEECVLNDLFGIIAPG